MKPLDPKTLEALAEIITGDNGPYYRKGSELPSFFRAAGLSCPSHDGSTRKWWTLERLTEYNENPAAMTRILSRLADPREYPANPEALNGVMQQLNRLLAVEGLRVELVGTVPRMVEQKATIAPSNENKVFALATPAFHIITPEPDMQAILERRWKETVSAIKAGAFLAAVVMLGGILEGVFLALAVRYPDQANRSPCAPKGREGKVKLFGDWSLSEMINVAHNVGWIQRDAKDFSQALRDFRNLIHPWEQRAKGDYPDEDTVNICLPVVQAALNDTIQYVKAREVTHYEQHQH